jgi:hypothetical protein
MTLAPYDGLTNHYEAIWLRNIKAESETKAGAIARTRY